MASTTFVDQKTVITADWANDVNNIAYNTVPALATSAGSNGVGFIQAGTGAVSRKVQDKLRETLSVKDFGAKGDWNGTTGTDDYAAIQAAINYARANGLNYVYLPAGRYRITKPLYLWGSDNYIRTGVSLRGDGVQATTIVKTGNGTTADGSWYGSVDACVIFTPFPAPVSSTPSTGTYNVGLYDLTVEGATGTPNTFGVYTKDDFGQIKVERVCVIGQNTTFRTDANMWLTSWENVSLHPVQSGFWMNASGTSVNLKNVYVLGGGAGGGIGFNLQSLYSHAESIACEGFTGTPFQFRFAGWTCNGLGVECDAATGAAITVTNSSSVVINSGLILCPNGVQVATGCSLKMSAPQFGDQFAPVARSGYLWFIGGTGALCIENLRQYDTFGTANTGFAMVTDLSGTQPFKPRSLDIQSITSDNTASAINAQNSASQLLFRVRNDGVFWTGLAAASPYNNTSAAAANLGVDSNGILFRSTSSIRYKKNVQDASWGLADVMKLRPVTYEGIAERDAGKPIGGLIAEEVHAAGLTDFVVYDKDGRPDALSYANMAALLIKSMQELADRVQQLEAGRSAN